MPTIGELIKRATKTEYTVCGAKITIERRSMTETEKPKKDEKGREEYFNLRDTVWARIRKELKELEGFQRYLKIRTKLPPHDLHRSKYFRKMIERELESNTQTLNHMYRLIEFTRRGTKVPGAEQSEKFFNLFFTGKKEFKNQYWTYWNKRHNKDGVKVSVEKVSAPESKKPYRCPDCNSFVSRKTNYCARCKKLVK